MEDTIKINGIEYIKKGLKTNDNFILAKPKNKMPYVIVRSYSAGVFAGYLKKREGKETEIVNARRIWFWKGAASLSQLAMNGTSKPEECKFPEPVSKIIVTETIEILEVSEKAKKIIESVPIWSE